METYNHYLNTYNEYNQNLHGDLILALFMIKLLSVKPDLINFIPEYKLKPVMILDMTNLTRLLNLGYGEPQATNALMHNGNSYDRAEKWLLEGEPKYRVNEQFNLYVVLRINNFIINFDYQ